MNRFKALVVVCVLLAVAPAVLGQRTQSEQTTAQRLDVLTSKFESMRRELNTAISAMNTSKNKDSAKPNADDPVVRLKGLEKEVSSALSEVHDIRAKNDRAEKYDPSAIDRLEATATELTGRVESGLQSTASARTGATAAAASSSKKKKKGKFFGLFGGGEDKYADLTG